MKDYNQFLKKQNKLLGHYSDSVWSLQNLEAGFEKFYDENGHYPSSPEVDKFEYLPSSKQIQRVFGGLHKLREDMHLEHEVLDHNRGSIRSKIAGESMIRSMDYEEVYYNYLIKQIPELYVHEHKVIRHKGKKTATDFFIYFPDLSGGVAIDIFYAMDLLNLMKQVRIKEIKYEPMPYRSFFVSMNKDISQDMINTKTLNRKIKLPDNVEVYNVDYFNSKILPTIKSRFDLFKSEKNLGQVVAN